MIRITVLIENTKSDYKLKAQHGLSFLIEFSGKKILYDFGQDGKFIDNCEKLQIDLTDINYAVLSHHHYDHGGGINDFFKYNLNNSVITTNNIKSKYYTKLFDILKISIGVNIKEKFNHRVVSQDVNYQIDENIYLISEIPTLSITNVINEALFVEKNRVLMKDTFDHENALVIDDNGYLTIFNSCSHKGVINTINAVKAKFPDKEIKNYIGGFHLYNQATKRTQTDKFIKELGNELSKTNVIFYTCHCTGEYSFNILKRILKNKISLIKTGDVIKIPN